MRKASVKHIVRATDCSYSKEQCQAAGVLVHDMAFPDGEPPPDGIIARWLRLCDETFAKKDSSAIAVHCVAGLGRAPVLVAIALIEKGMEPLDAVKLIRDKRRGAINAKQVRSASSPLPAAGRWRAAAPPFSLPQLILSSPTTFPHPFLVTTRFFFPPILQLTYLDTGYKRRKGGCTII